MRGGRNHNHLKVRFNSSKGLVYLLVWGTAMPQHPSLPPTTLRHSRLSHWSGALQSLCSYIANVRSRTDPAKEKKIIKKPTISFLIFKRICPQTRFRPQAALSAQQRRQRGTQTRKGGSTTLSWYCSQVEGKATGSQCRNRVHHTNEM